MKHLSSIPGIPLILIPALIVVLTFGLAGPPLFKQNFLHAETVPFPEIISEETLPTANDSGTYNTFKMLPFPLFPVGLPGLKMPLVWDGISHAEPEHMAITGGSMCFENNTLIMNDLTVRTPPMVYKNIRPEGAPENAGFGTIYRKSGERTISGTITFEPLP